MTGLFINIFVGIMNGIYSLYRGKPVKGNKVTMISRESREEPLDFRLLREALEKDGVEVVVLAKLFEKSPSYFVELIRQMKHIATSKVVVLDTYSIAASILNHKRETKFVQIWHSSAAIKKFGLQTVGRPDGANPKVAKSMKMHKNYDYIFAPCEETGRAFCEAFGYGPEVVRYMALPRLQYLYEAPKGPIGEIYPDLDEGKKTIIYAPTFRRSGKIKVEELISSLDPEKYNILVKPHMLDEGAYENILSDRVKVARDMDTYDLLCYGDILISDYSSLVVEATVRDLPIYIYAFDYEDYAESTGLNLDLEKTDLGKYFFRDAGDLAKALEEPYDLEREHRFRDKFLKANYREATEKAAEFIEELLKG